MFERARCCCGADKPSGMAVEALVEAINAQASMPVSAGAVRAALQTATQDIMLIGNLAKHKHAA